MDENRMSGTAKSFEGKVEEGFGCTVGDAKTAAQGQVKQAKGGIQDLYGQAMDGAGETIDAVRKSPRQLWRRHRQGVAPRHEAPTHQNYGGQVQGAEQCWKISGPDLLAKSRGLLAPRSIEETKRRPAYAGHNEFSHKVCSHHERRVAYWEMALH